MAPSDHPILVLVPGASQSPSHYAYLLHLLQSRGYGTLSALLPSTGFKKGEHVTAEDDANFVRDRMIIPQLDVENHNVVVITHSYSSMPASAAVKRLGKSERAAQGKSTAVLGQIHIAAVLPKGGDGKSVFDLFGGQIPPHIQLDEPNNMLRCPDPRPALFNDVSADAANIAVMQCMNPSYSSWSTACPPASWAEKDFQGRNAYIRTLQDACFPTEIQKAMTDGTGQEWIIKEIDSGHSPQLTQPEKLADILIDLVHHFESL